MRSYYVTLSLLLLTFVTIFHHSNGQYQPRLRKRRGGMKRDRVSGNEEVNNEETATIPTPKKSNRKFKYTPSCNKLVGIYRTLDQLETKCGYSPKAVLDIGANSGDWSSDFSRYFPSARFFLIEATEMHRPALEKHGFPFEIALVGDTPKKVKFYTNANTGNTMFRQYNVVSTDTSKYEEREMRTIDEIISSRQAGTFDFLKIDIQGAELIALQGASEVLKHVEVLTIEASVLNYNVGGATFHDIHTFLHQSGFALYDIFDMMRNNKGDPGFLVQMDLLFVRTTSNLWSKQCTGIESRTGNN